MDLNGPKRLTWWIALLIWIGVFVGIVGILGSLGVVPLSTVFAFWLLAIGWFLLAAAAGIIYLRVLK